MLNDFKAPGKGKSSSVCTSSLHSRYRRVRIPSPKFATCGHLPWDPELVPWPLLPCELDEWSFREVLFHALKGNQAS